MAPRGTESRGLPLSHGTPTVLPIATVHLGPAAVIHLHATILHPRAVTRTPRAVTHPLLHAVTHHPHAALPAHQNLRGTIDWAILRLVRHLLEAFLTNHQTITTRPHSQTIPNLFLVALTNTQIMALQRLLMVPLQQIKRSQVKKHRPIQLHQESRNRRNPRILPQSLLQKTQPFMPKYHCPSYLVHLLQPLQSLEILPSIPSIPCKSGLFSQDQ